MARPKLTREDCAEIRRMYADPSRRETSGTLARLFRVSAVVILKVIDRKYTPLEDYEERCSKKREAANPEPCGPTPLERLPFPVVCRYPGCGAGPFTNGIEVDEHISEEHLPEAVWTFAEENMFAAEVADGSSRS